MRRALLAALGLVAVAAGTAAAQDAKVTTFVEGPTAGPDEEPLNHPVPIPVDSELPMGFRVYARLEDRLASLASSPVLTRVQIGTSREQRPIWAVRLSDADQVRDDGSVEPRILLSGLAHSREWVSAETVMRFVEHMVEGYKEEGGDVVEFLLRNLEIYAVPVLNPDGLVYTQNSDRYDKFVDYFEAADNEFFGERDGRLLRKNLFGHLDQDFLPVTRRSPIAYLSLSDAFEGLLGVDLNRNNPKGYANPNAHPDSPNSPDPRSDNFRGTAGATEASYDPAAAEPEIKAIAGLVASPTLTNSLHGFIDFHAFGEYIVQPLTADSTRNAIVGDLRGRMKEAAQRVRSTVYLTGSAFDVTPAQTTGALDEAVAYSPGQPPAFTVELSPDIASYPNDPRGFVLRTPDLADAAREGREMALVMADFAAGPAYLRKVVVWQDRPEGAAAPDGRIDPLEIVYEAQWDPDPADATRRVLAVRQKRSLEPGPARLLLVFSEPMKLSNPDGDPVEADGTTAAGPLDDVKVIMPVTLAEIPVTAVSGSGWLGTRDAPDADGLEPGYERYRFDTWEGGFTWSPPAAGVVGSPGLEVAAADLFGNALDGKPDTVARWNRAWVTFEDDAGGDGQGGVDRLQVFEIDTAPPSITITVDQPATGFPGQSD